MLGILRIMCVVIDGQQAGRKFNSQMTQPTNVLNCRTHAEKDHRSDSMGPNKRNVKHIRLFQIQCKYRRKEVSRIITLKIHSKFIDAFTGIGCLRAH